MNKKMLKWGAIICTAIICVGFGIMSYIRWGMPVPAPATPIVQVTPTPKPDPTPIVPYVPTTTTTSGTKDNLTQETDENGNVNISQEMGKPTPPPKPEYTEEELTNPDTPPTPPTVDVNNPKPGDKLNGSTYIPGFGWVADNDPGCGGVTIEGNIGSLGEQIGQ